MKAPRLILASASPARAELLREAGFEFKVLPAPEAVEREAVAVACRRGLGPGELALVAARSKAAAVAGSVGGGQWAVGGGTAPTELPPTVVILGADTVTVSARGRIIGKGADEREEAGILAELAGTRHRVITGVALVAVPGGRRRELLAESEVEMAPLSPAEIAAYVASGASRGAAGAYRIQRADADRWVRVVAGSLSNVVGLPVEMIIPALAEFSVLPARRDERDQ